MRLDAEFRDAVDEAREPATYEAVVLAAPASVSKGLKVRVAGFDGFQGTNVFGPMPWQPRYVVGATTVTVQFPAKGDRALVAFTDAGQAWCPCWWPASYD
jgi:hypothetical protein